MGTRGQLVFCWKGRRLIIYNHYDSYPSMMGAELFKQLVALLQRFQGDVKRACQNWGALVEAIEATYSEDEAAHPFNKIHAFDDVEEALRSTLPLCVCEEEGLDMWIEFIWTVDLDDGVLTMDAHGGRAEWSFSNLHRGRSLRDKWIEEANIFALGDDIDVDVISATPFAEAVTSAAAVQIQTAARRYLEVSRGLRPGGVLAKLAATRFRRAASFLDYGKACGGSQTNGRSCPVPRDDMLRRMVHGESVACNPASLVRSTSPQPQDLQKSMKIVHAISGEEIAELDDALDQDAKTAASEALGVHPALLRVKVQQCSVMVLSGKILCRRCAARVACSCKAEEDACRCEAVQSDVAKGPVLCDACEERDRQMEDVEEWLQHLRDEEWGRW